LHPHPQVDGSFRVAVWGPQKWAGDRCQQLEEQGLEASWIGHGRAGPIHLASPALLLLDAPAAPALEMLRRLPRALAHVRVVLLARKANPQQIIEALSLGISGCAAASIDSASLRTLLEQVQSGQLIVEPMLGASLWEATRCRRASNAEHLTPREEQVLSLLSRGLTNARIADQLGVSRATVRTHLGHIYQKLEAANRVEAVARAVAGGLL